MQGQRMEEDLCLYGKEFISFLWEERDGRVDKIASN